MSGPEVLALTVTIVAAAFGLWLGFRITKRAGIVPIRLSLGRKLLTAVALTGAIVIGLSVGNDDALNDPGTIVMGAMFWLFAMFMTFRRPKGA